MTQRQHTERDKDDTHARYQAQSPPPPHAGRSDTRSRDARGAPPTAASPGRLLQSVGAGAGTGTQRRAPRRHRRLGGDPGPGHPGELPFFPDSSRPRARPPTSSASATSPAITDQQVQDQKGKTQICAPLLWFDEYSRRSATTSSHRHEPRPAGPPGPRPTGTPCTGTGSQRDPVLRRRARDVALGPDRARPDLLLPAARRRARTCTTATSRTSSTCRWA